MKWCVEVRYGEDRNGRLGNARRGEVRRDLEGLAGKAGLFFTLN